MTKSIMDLDNISNAGCNSSEEYHHIIFSVKMGSSVVSFCANFLAIAVFLVGGSYKRLIFRLVFYLLGFNLLLVLVQVLELTPVTYSNGHVHVRRGSWWEGMCSAMGYLDQVTAWMRNCIIFFIVCVTFKLVKSPAKFMEKQDERSKWIELFGVCACIFLPFTVNWIPFVNGYFGLSGHWCWIKLTLECGGEDVAFGLLYILLFYYCPLLLLVLVTSLICCYTLYKWCTNQNKPWEIVLVILYPIVFDFLCVVMTVNRIDSALRIKDETAPLFSLWVLHAIADSGRTILPPICVLLSLVCHHSRRMLCPRFQKGDEERRHLVPPGRQDV